MFYDEKIPLYPTEHQYTNFVFIIFVLFPNLHLFTIVKNGVIIMTSLLLESTLAIFQMAH